MSEHQQTIERLREILLRFETEKVTLLSKFYALGKVTPSLSSAEITQEEKQHYYHHGFIDGVKFFQSLVQNYPKRMAPYIVKAGERP